MPELRFGFAASIDGYIAGPAGEYDWIPMDPDIDFAAMFARYGALVMGRRSYEVFAATGGEPGPQVPTYVYSRTLPPGERDGITFVQDAVPHVRELKRGPGDRAIWLWGGADLFRTLAEADLVDGIDIAIVPVILGGGLPLMAVPGPTLSLELQSHRIYPKTGTLYLEYGVRKARGSRSKK